MADKDQKLLNVCGGWGVEAIWVTILVSLR